MKATRRMFFALVGAMAVGAASAAPSVEITSVQQQYPWTNTVDIVYNVAGVDSETNGYFVVFTPTTSTGEPILDVNGQKSVQVALKGSGVYSTQWFPQTNQQYTACKMTPSVFRGAAKDYLIIDLEDWSVTYEPMATQEASNQRYNTEEYKTKKMVFRRIPADTYTVGHDKFVGRPHDSNGCSNTTHTVVAPVDYYCAIFRTTEAQYERIANGNKTATAKSAKKLSWNIIRGSSLVTAIPSSGILKTMRDKTGLMIDLPTRAMTEVALRAKSRAYFDSGEDDVSTGESSSISQNIYYIWCYDNAKGATDREVGLLLPNAWGLYDCTGLNSMWCRDVAPAKESSFVKEDATLGNVFVPISVGATSSRLCLDSSSSNSQGNYRMTASCYYPTSPNNTMSFRLAVYPDEYYPNGGK